MTADQAIAFIDEIKANKSPSIGGYLSRITAPVSPAIKIRGVGPLVLGIGLAPLVFDSSYTWKNYAADVACGIVFGCGDTK
jgi:hypothetical protein